MEFDSPKGKMIFRKEDHQALQPMYVFKVKGSGANDWDLLDLVREIPIAELPVPIRNKR
jgi:branched-chain amino acid transport system substrate-binding protein